MPRLLLLVPALVAVLLPAPAASAAGARHGGVQHTVTAYTVERGGALERSELVETWRSASRAKIVYTDARTRERLGACIGTPRRIRCNGREAGAGGAGDGRRLVSWWADSERHIRRALARRWLAETGPVVHRGTAARRFASTPDATGDPGETVLIATRRSLSLLFRQTRSVSDGVEVVATEDVLLRERLPLRDVDFGLGSRR